MLWLAFCICVVGFIISIILERNLYNPITIYTALWGVIILLYQMNPYNLPLVNNDTKMMICFGIISFIFGSFVLGNLRVKPKLSFTIVKRRTHSSVINIDLKNTGIIMLLQILAIIIFLVASLSSISALLAGYGLTYIRYTLRTHIMNTGIIGSLFTYIAEPVMYFSIPYSSILLLQKKIDKRTVILTVLLIVLDLLTNGGRIAIMFCMICIFFTLLISQSRLEVKLCSKTKKIMIFAIIIIAFAMAQIVLERGSDLIKSTITYLYAPLATFEFDRKIFDNGDYVFTYGFLSFQGFIRPLLLLFGFRTSSFVQCIDDVYKLIDSAIYLETLRFNSSVTYMGYFYFDFGLCGIVCGSALLGMICYRYYSQIVCQREINMSNVCVYLLLLGTVVFSFISFMFATPGYSLAMLIVLVLKGKKYKLKDNI